MFLSTIYESETLRGSSEYIHHVPEHRMNRIDRFYAVAIQIAMNSIIYFHWKILAFAGIWTQDLPGTKLICYQLSYSGLDQ